tara:strand:- start:18258 stop:18392 length:135 start_codon:yes stop_codon:yes gene_type:complete
MKNLKHLKEFYLALGRTGKALAMLAGIAIILFILELLGGCAWRF